jgi:hypothetical protein
VTVCGVKEILGIFENSAMPADEIHPPIQARGATVATPAYGIDGLFLVFLVL